MHRLLLAFALVAPGIAQKPLVTEEVRLSTRLAWLREVVRPVELRIDYGAAEWRAPYGQEVDRRTAATLRLGNGGWATLHAGTELHFGERKLPAGIWYLALQRSAEAEWSLAIVEAAKAMRQGVLPGACRDLKPALLVPMTLRSGLGLEPRLRIALAGGEDPGTATLSLRWGDHELSTTVGAELEAAAAAPAPQFRVLDPERRVETASGLRFEELRPGLGTPPGAKSAVRVDYVGWLSDGTRFDSSLDRGQPVTFKLEQVIKGWTEGLQLMNPGAVFLFEIPPYLAYGKRGAGNVVPANSTLWFWVELHAVE